MNFYAEKIRQSIASWYYTKLSFTDIKDKLTEEDLKKLYELMEKINLIRFEINKILTQKKYETN
jgi:hypothetical protein